jgi:hypothetical protein
MSGAIRQIEMGVFKIDNPEVRLLREVELRRSASLTDFECTQLKN